MTQRPRRPAFRPQTESLESRNLMAVFTVTRTDHPFGVGTLNWAINESNKIPGGNTIVFRIPGQGVQTIEEPRTGFPAITRKVTIDGFTQPGSQRNTSTNPAINNTQWGILLLGLSHRPILTVDAGGTGSEIRGLVFGSLLTAPNNNTAGVQINRANLVKLDGDGFAAAENSGLNSAVMINGGSFDTVGGDVAGTPALQNVMNSYQIGVNVRAGSQHNAIFGNYVGGQTSAIGNLRAGLVLATGANNNTVVGNVLVGNAEPIANLGSGNVIEGNIIINT
ncbi:MAG TPA: hypothetical protein VGH33_08170 [Isosphaeraceae bacterium]|jgi:hypothetical protein